MPPDPRFHTPHPRSTRGPYSRKLSFETTQFPQNQILLCPAFGHWPSWAPKQSHNAVWAHWVRVGAMMIKTGSYKHLSMTHQRRNQWRASKLGICASLNVSDHRSHPQKWISAVQKLTITLNELHTGCTNSRLYSTKLLIIAYLLEQWC